MGGVLAIDLGEKRTGFAFADALRITSVPLDVCEAPATSEELLEHVAAHVRERDVSVLLVGLPLNMDGTAGERARAAEAFAARLRERFPALRVTTWDERLSTKEAEDLQRGAGVPVRRRRASRDSWAALVVLRDWVRSGEP